jgi:tRNA-specific 2-thiouridylase
MRHGEAEPVACATDSAAGRLAIVSTARSNKQGCCSASDALDARRVADRLGIAFYALNFADDFGRIVDYFVDEYLAARTPNPCVMCNNWLKFGKLVEYADSIAADYIATGHYARLVAADDGTPSLCRGRDATKDQSYVLFGIQRGVLSRLLFPVGDFEKHEIRDIAHRIGLRVADKKDSQEICFVPSGDYAAFVERHRPEQDTSGDLVTTGGEVVGQHPGIENLTIGQRKGLGVAFGEPRYVVRVEPDTRRVVIGQREELARTEFFAERTNWLADMPPGAFRCDVKIRYTCKPAAANVSLLPPGRMRVVADEPLFGVAPGQAAVCYDGDRVLGGGWIA